MEQHQQATQAPGVAGHLLATGGSTEHFASPASPILEELATMDVSFDNEELGKQPGSANAAAITLQAAAIPSQLKQSPEDAATSKADDGDAVLDGDAVAHPAFVKMQDAEEEVLADNEGDNRHTLQQCSPHH